MSPRVAVSLPSRLTPFGRWYLFALLFVYCPQELCSPHVASVHRLLCDLPRLLHNLLLNKSVLFLEGLILPPTVGSCTVSLAHQPHPALFESDEPLRIAASSAVGVLCPGSPLSSTGRRSSQNHFGQKNLPRC